MTEGDNIGKHYVTGEFLIRIKSTPTSSIGIQLECIKTQAWNHFRCTDPTVVVMNKNPHHDMKFHIFVYNLRSTKIEDDVSNVMRFITQSWSEL